MSDDCQEVHKYRRYKRLSAPRFDRLFEADPPGAPKATTSNAEIAKAIIAKVDADIEKRNQDYPSCGACDEISRARVDTKVKARNVYHWFKENFEVKDQNGNVLTATAHYRVLALVDVQVDYWELECDKPFGDSPHVEDLKLEGELSWDLKVNIGMGFEAGFDLEKYYELLGDDLRTRYDVKLNGR